MNLLGMLTCWTGGQLSGISGWFTLAPAAQILPRGDRPRHATGHLADATGQSSRLPDDLEDATDGPECSPDGLEDATGHLSRSPGHSSRSPGDLEHAPTRPERLPSEPEGSGAERRRGMVARRGGMDGARTGLVDPRKGGVFVPEGRRGAPPRHGWSIARGLFAPTGRRDVATGGASRSDAEPVGRFGVNVSCPGGAEGRSDRGMRHGSSAPAGAGFHIRPSPTGCVGEAPTPPVATGRDPSGVEGGGRVFVPPTCRSGQVGAGGVDRAKGAPTSQSRSRWHERHRAGGVQAFAGAVPEAPMAARPSGLYDASGSGVRRG